MRLVVGTPQGEHLLVPVGEEEGAWTRGARFQAPEVRWVEGTEGEWWLRLRFAPHECFQAAPLDEPWLVEIPGHPQAGERAKRPGRIERVSVWECQVCQTRKAFRYQWNAGSGQDSFWFEVEE